MTTLLFQLFLELVQSAKLLVKEDCILAGVELAEIIFKTFDKDLKVEVFIKDGENRAPLGKNQSRKTYTYLE